LTEEIVIENLSWLQKRKLRQFFKHAKNALMDVKKKVADEFKYRADLETLLLQFNEIFEIEITEGTMLDEKNIKTFSLFELEEATKECLEMMKKVI